MNIQKMEELLLQEMEDVKGGGVGLIKGCSCKSGAGQASDGSGPCYCSEGELLKRHLRKCLKIQLNPSSLAIVNLEQDRKSKTV